MVYQWKLPGLYDVPAQAAGEELDRIYKERGKMDASDIVEESRPHDAVLHSCFEWNDTVAAEAYREVQAREICRCIVVRKEQENSPNIETRAFVHVENTYQPMSVVIQHKDKYQILKEKALAELQAFSKKFSVLKNDKIMKELFTAIDAVKMEA